MVECDFSKVDVAGSSPVARSILFLDSSRNGGGLFRIVPLVYRKVPIKNLRDFYQYGGVLDDSWNTVGYIF